ADVCAKRKTFKAAVERGCKASCAIGRDIMEQLCTRKQVFIKGVIHGHQCVLPFPMGAHAIGNAAPEEGAECGYAHEHITPYLFDDGSCRQFFTCQQDIMIK